MECFLSSIVKLKKITVGKKHMDYEISGSSRVAQWAGKEGRRKRESMFGWMS